MPNLSFAKNYPVVREEKKIKSKKFFIGSNIGLKFFLIILLRALNVCIIFEKYPFHQTSHHGNRKGLLF